MTVEFDELKTALGYIGLGGGKPAASATAPAPSSSTAKGKAAAEDDLFGADDDLFGDDDDEDNKKSDIYDDDDNDAETKARRARMEAARKEKEAADAKKPKKPKKEKEAERSLIVLDVKPWEADTNLEELWKKIIEYKKEGLTWGATFKLEPVAFGIKKLVMTCTIVDKLIVMDDITDVIEGFEDYVQSVTIASFNKI